MPVRWTNWAAASMILVIASAQGGPMRAIAESWQRQPFVSGVPVPYEAAFDARALALVRLGFIPEAMEDKWCIYYEEPYVYFHRSWTGDPVFRVELTPTAEGAAIREALWSTSSTKASDAVLQQQARQVESLVANFLLRRPGSGETGER